MQWSILIEKAINGDIQIMSRLISAVENRQTGWITAMKEIFPHAGKSKIIGITGAPGAGKSTLTGKLAQHYVSQGLRVAVIAIDLMAQGQSAPPILKAVSTTGEGISDIAHTLDTQLMASHTKKPHRNTQEETYDLYEHALKNLLWQELEIIEKIKAATNKATLINPYQIVDEIIPIKQIGEYLQHGLEDE
jgi:putative protein kinase ArgK-like GTPase of G3E family